MSGALERAGLLLAAASQAPTRELRIVYCAEGRLALAHALDEIAAHQRLLDAIECEIARTTTTTQLAPTTSETAR